MTQVHFYHLADLIYGPIWVNCTYFMSEINKFIDISCIGHTWTTPFQAQCIHFILKLLNGHKRDVYNITCFVHHFLSWFVFLKNKGRGLFVLVNSRRRWSTCTAQGRISEASIRASLGRNQMPRRSSCEVHRACDWAAAGEGKELRSNHLSRTPRPVKISVCELSQTNRAPQC